MPDLNFPAQPQPNEKILIVDDEETIRSTLRDALRAMGLRCIVVESVCEARERLEREALDLVITDVVMPDETGVDLLRWCRERQDETPFVVMTGFADTDLVIDALNLGAQFFLKKPFHLEDIRNAVNTALSRRRYENMQENLQKHLEDANTALRQKVIDAIIEQEALFLGCLSSLAQTIDARDPYTHQHSAAVAALSRRLARHMGLSVEDQHAAQTAGMLHDIGKIAVPETILQKPSRLTEDEFAIMREHPVRAAAILSPLPGLEASIPAIRAHHEQYAGGGYPDGTRGPDIPYLARILNICDSWDAMTSDRPYRRALKRRPAMDELERECGKQFDPEIFDQFIDLVERRVVKPSKQSSAESKRFRK